VINFPQDMTHCTAQRWTTWYARWGACGASCWPLTIIEDVEPPSMISCSVILCGDKRAIINFPHLRSIFFRQHNSGECRIMI